MKCTTARYQCGNVEDSISARGHVAWTSRMVAGVANLLSSKGLSKGSSGVPTSLPLSYVYVVSIASHLKARLVDKE